MSVSIVGSLPLTSHSFTVVRPKPNILLKSCWVRFLSDLNSFSLILNLLLTKLLCRISRHFCWQSVRDDINKNGGKRFMEQKTCENCVYYLPHYIKEDTRYQAIHCGHCINKKQGGHFRRTDKICKSYKKRNEGREKKERLKSITEYLAFIAKCLNELTEFLKN